MRRSLVGVVLAALFLGLATAPSASAHSAADSPASNLVSKVLRVAPADAPFAVRVIEAGSRIEVRWRRGPALVVPDYDGHPYLRIGPAGVEENTQSNAVYLNRTRSGGAAIPTDLRPEGPPTWQRTSAEPVARWHDHRIHWMGSSTPVRDGGREQVVYPDWQIAVRSGSTAYVVHGELRWVPGPSPLPWYALAVAVTALLVGPALWAGRDRARRRLVRAVAVAALGLLVVCDGVHLFGIAFGTIGPVGAALGRVVSIGYTSLAAWVMAAVAAVLLARGREDALYLAVFSAGLMTVVGGIADAAVLARSAVPFAFGVGVARPVIALTLGLGIGVAVAGVLLTRPEQRPIRGAASPEVPRAEPGPDR